METGLEVGELQSVVNSASHIHFVYVFLSTSRWTLNMQKYIMSF